MAADKDRTAQVLRSAGIPVPVGRLLGPTRRLPSDFPYPAVMKPVDGAGSLDIRFVSGPDDSAADANQAAAYSNEFRPGAPASVAVLCGPTCHCRSHPAVKPSPTTASFTISAGRVPRSLAIRSAGCPACRAGDRRTARPVRLYRRRPGPRRAPADGSADVVIEINPRLTTSYIGLRRATDANLAGLMLTIAAGGQAKATFRERPMRFVVGDIS